ncbi:hypothetical protein FF1_007851 [Malus domestica]|uniref:Uncharacterized protein n=1 Tax=Malus baccata TaxID=106549 RepID=A0A540MWB2_MALBA|nr:hypothetical protein C1H46_011257 [Malus baccata]
MEQGLAAYGTLLHDFSRVEWRYESVHNLLTLQICCLPCMSNVLSSSAHDYCKSAHELQFVVEAKNLPFRVVNLVPLMEMPCESFTVDTVDDPFGAEQLIAS